MGNCTSSCNCMISPRIKTNKAARVILPLGEIRQFQVSVKAAEIMFECPNFFLVNWQSLNINKRFLPLSADEELESGNIYVMFPMKRLNSMVTPTDMEVFWISANSAAKRITTDSESENVNVNVDADFPEFTHRLVACRSRKPLLDTIMEESVSCR